MAELRRWLGGLPRHEVQQIAVRAALRVLPLTLQRSADASLVVAVFRAALVSWVACRSNGTVQQLTNAAAGAAVAARAAADRSPIQSVVHAASYALANAAGSVAVDKLTHRGSDFVVSSASAALTSAAEAADTSDNEAANRAQSVLIADANWLLAHKSEANGLTDQPLWLVEMRGDDVGRYNVNMPLWARRPLDDFAESDLGKGPWGVWVAWYRQLLPVRRRQRSSNFDEEKLLVVASQPEKFWQGDPHRVTANVAALVGWKWDESAWTWPDEVEANPQSVPDPIQQTKDRISEPPQSPLKAATDAAFIADNPNPDFDHLDRAPLAFVLAGRLNQVWDSMNVAPPTSQNQLVDSARWTGHQSFSWDDPLRPGFVVHIDAPWGGGKTSFAKLLTRILNPYRQEKLPGWMRALHLDDPRYWPERYRRPWHIVNFNAWRHQHVKPPWWVFAEAIRKQCSDAIRRETNCLPETELPAPSRDFAYLSWFYRHINAIGNWIAERMWRVCTPDFLIKSLAAGFAVAVLLALLSAGWIAAGEKGANPTSSVPFWLAPLLVLIFGGASVWTVFYALTQTLIPGTPEAAQNYALGAGDPLDRFRRHFETSVERFRRPVLVVVDDLDRCDPSYVTELVRGMQTILTSRRVVFLLLGDRDWIEQSFAETHKTMKGVYVGTEHEFGGRFVEKAIQFSFVLPEIPNQKRVGYIRKLLGIESDDSELTQHRTAIEEVNLAAREVLANKDYTEREVAAAKLRESDLVRNLVQDARADAMHNLDIQLSLRAATDESAERATRHMLEALAPLLPPNPRQIKRIVNAISLMQEAARLAGLAQPGSPEWQVLARWIVIMIEWPKSFFTLSRYPGLADAALNKKTRGELPRSNEKEFVARLKANKDVLTLMTFSDQANGWIERNIDSREIAWLRTLMPPASGRLLDVDAKVAAEATKTLA